jgi:hypothetical protein
MAGITLAQAEEKLALWMAADEAVSRGQSYSIAGRNLSRTDAAEIQNRITFWDAKVKSMTASASGRRRTRYVVPE